MMNGLLPLLLLTTGLLVEPPPAAPRFMAHLFTEAAGRDHAPGVSSGELQPLALGERITLHAFASGNQCGFSAGARDIPSTAAIGWTVEITPVTMTTDDARLLVRWSRAVLRGQRTREEPQESTIFFRPGDVVRLDALRVPQAPCADMVGALSLELQALPAPAAMRTLTATDLWLVHRQPNGREVAQHLEVRGKFNAPQAFFFDGIRIGSSVIDVFGELKLRARSTGKIGLELSAQRHLIVEGPTRTDGFPDAVAGYWGYGTPDVKTDVGHQDVTSFEIPFGSGPEWAPFAGHGLSLRVKSRRIR